MYLRDGGTDELAAMLPSIGREDRRGPPWDWGPRLIVYLRCTCQWSIEGHTTRAKLDVGLVSFCGKKTSSAMGPRVEDQSRELADLMVDDARLMRSQTKANGDICFCRGPESESLLQLIIANIGQTS